MKTHAPLRSFTPLQRKTPLRSTRKPFPSKGPASPVVAADATGEASLEALAFPKPTRAQRSKAKLASRRPIIGGSHASRSTKALSRVGTETQPPVALEGRLQPLGFKFAKPAPRLKAVPAPLKRSRMKKRRARRIDRETPEEAFFKDAVHRLPCVGIAHFPDHACDGDTEQSHERSIAKGSGMGVKLKNTECCAMCWALARAWDANRGAFHGWTKAQRMAWMAERVKETKAVLGAAWARRNREMA